MQQYLWKRNVSFLQLRSQKVRFYKKWGKRDYRMTYMKILKRRSNYIDVQTTVRWKRKGYRENQAGKDIQKVRLVPKGNSFKVLALKNLRHTVYTKPKVVEEINTTVLLREKNETKASLEPEKLAKGDSAYYIQVASFFKDISPAYLNNIRKNSFPYVIQKVMLDEKGPIQRVLIGPFDSTTLAQESLGIVRKKISKNAYLKTLVN
jgi:hypothetical protein